MRAELLELMRVLANGAIADEALAVEISKVAEASIREGRLGEAASLRAVARNHRIRALELQARIAALEEFYSSQLT